MGSFKSFMCVDSTALSIDGSGFSERATMYMELQPVFIQSNKISTYQIFIICMRNFYLLFARFFCCLPNVSMRYQQGIPFRDCYIGR